MNLWVMNADGSGQMNLTPGANDGEGHTGIRPTWSTDGSRIAYNDNGEDLGHGRLGGGQAHAHALPRRGGLATRVVSGRHLRPRALAALIPVSSRLLRDAPNNPSIEEVVRGDVAEVMALRAGP